MWGSPSNTFQTPLCPQHLGDLEQDLGHTGLSLHISMRGSQSLLAGGFVYAWRQAGVVGGGAQWRVLWWSGMAKGRGLLARSLGYEGFFNSAMWPGDRGSRLVLC